MFSAQNTLLELYSEVGRKLQVKVVFKKDWSGQILKKMHLCKRGKLV